MPLFNIKMVTLVTIDFKDKESKTISKKLRECLSDNKINYLIFPKKGTIDILVHSTDFAKACSIHNSFMSSISGSIPHYVVHFCNKTGSFKKQK